MSGRRVHRAWTAVEEERVREFYPICKAVWLSENILPGRSEQALLARALRLGVKRMRETADVTERVRGMRGRIASIAHATELTVEQVLAALDAAVGRHDSRVDGWTDEEDAVLYALYALPDGINRVARALPRRSRESVKMRARALGVRNLGMYRGSWTAVEDARLQLFYPLCGPDPLPGLCFPDRTAAAVRSRARLRCINRSYSRETIAGRVRDIRARIDEVARELELSVEDCEAVLRAAAHPYAQKAPPKSGPKGEVLWTSEEDDMLRVHYPDHTAKWIVENLLPRRTDAAIQCRAAKLGVRRYEACQQEWTEAEEEKLRELYPLYTAPHLSSMFFPGRSAKAILARARVLGLRKSTRKQHKLEPKCDCCEILLRCASNDGTRCRVCLAIGEELGRKYDMGALEALEAWRGGALGALPVAETTY